MRGRRLVVPAAGRGTRLGSSQPKLLVPVADRPMIDWLLALYEPLIDSAVLVVHPSAEDQVRRHLAGTSVPVFYVRQPEPTGMLDAILLARSVGPAGQAGHVWITWCDQVAVSPGTVQRLVQECAAHSGAAVVMPTVTRPHPYVHLERNGAGTIVRVLHRREGDQMPAEGQSDMGLFALSSECFDRLLPEYARGGETGRTTAERNFLPFLPWVAQRAPVVTFPVLEAIEAVGVNTPEDLRAVEAHLRRRQERP